METIRDLKELINSDNLETFKRYVDEFIQSTEYPIDPAFIFQKVYLHACLKKRHEIVNYLLRDCFPLLDPIEQIAIRQVFSYGRVLLSKK
jgi:hypothetical protein